jgi:hypothetical protein
LVSGSNNGLSSADSPADSDGELKEVTIGASIAPAMPFDAVVRNVRLEAILYYFIVMVIVPNLANMCRVTS